MRLVAMAAAFVVGALSVAQSRINGELGRLLQDGIYAAWLSFSVGLIVVALIVLSIPKQRIALGRLRLSLAKDGNGQRPLRPWQLLGGIGGATFVAAQSTTVQYLGVALFTVAVVAAQNANSLVVDRVGLGPAGVQRFTVRRVAAAAAATVGVAITVVSRSGGGGFVAWALIFALLAGALIAIQQAINGRVANAAKSPWVAGLDNFVVGWIGLTIALLLSHLVTPHDWVLPPSIIDQPLLWVGGLIGVAFIVVAAAAVPRLGVLVFALLSIAGQVSGALFFELVAPEAGHAFSLTLVVGVLVTGGAVALAAVGREQVRSA